MNKELEYGSYIKLCPMCNRSNCISLTSEEYKRFLARNAPIQELLPELDPFEREMLMTGFCPDCQSLLFGTKYKGNRIHRGIFSDEPWNK